MIGEWWIWGALIGGWGGEEKKRSRSIFFGVFFIDALCRGWIGEWIGVGLRVGLGVY